MIADPEPSSTMSGSQMKWATDQFDNIIRRIGLFAVS
jgi:hypothetical protein